jgi:Spy/CpxP family protein refolding chaperone
MDTVRKLALASVVLALVCTPGLAQRRPPGGQGNPLMLLGQKSVQKELKLTDEQIEKASQFLKSRAAARQDLQELEGEAREKKVKEMAKENEKFLADTLKPEQAKRLKQLVLQQYNVQAFSQPDVVKELKLTAEQQQKFKDLDKEHQAHMLALRRPGGGGEEAMKKIGEVNKELAEKAQKLLTPEQQAKWKEMIGEPFKGELRMNRPGDRPGRPNNPDR